MKPDWDTFESIDRQQVGADAVKDMSEVICNTVVPQGAVGNEYYTKHPNFLIFPILSCRFSFRSPGFFFFSYFLL